MELSSRHIFFNILLWGVRKVSGRWDQFVKNCRFLAPSFRAAGPERVFDQAARGSNPVRFSSYDLLCLSHLVWASWHGEETTTRFRRAGAPCHHRAQGSSVNPFGYPPLSDDRKREGIPLWISRILCEFFNVIRKHIYTISLNFRWLFVAGTIWGTLKSMTID